MMTKDSQAAKDGAVMDQAKTIGQLRARLAEIADAMESWPSGRSFERILRALRGDLMLWQPIETVPKDGTVVLLFYPWSPRTNQVYVAAGYATSTPRWPWRVFDPEVTNNLNAWPQDSATHWMPLPAPPEQSDG